MVLPRFPRTWFERADYGSRGNEFSRRIKGIQLAIAEDAVSVDHLVLLEEAVRIAMARQ